MSAQRRRISRKKPYDELEHLEEELEPLEDELEPIADELEALDDELEPLEDELEPLEEMLEPQGDAGSGIDVALADLEDAAERERYDACVVATVPALDRAEVPGAVRAALARALPRLGDALRLRRVLLRFSGEAIIPSKTKDEVAQVFADLRPLLLAVQRGYDDEVVLENEMPAAELRDEAIDADESRRRVTIDTGDLVPAEQRIVLADRIEELGAAAGGKAFDVQFEGARRPDAELLAVLKDALAQGGARRLVLQTAPSEDAELLFDRELEALLRIEPAPDGDADTLVELHGDASDEQRQAAFGLVLPRAAERIAGQRVRVRAAGDAPGLPELVERLGQMRAARVELERPGDAPLVLLPKLLRSATKDDRTKIGVVPAGRDRAAVLEALARELPGMAAIVREHRILVEWPAGTQLDAELEQTCAGVFAPLAPTSVALRAGEARLPVLPVPVTLREEADEFGALQIVTIDTESGKPVDIAAAIERRLAAHADALRDQRVRIELRGSGPFSRTMRRTLFERLEHGGVQSAELVEQGQVDVILPYLLASRTTAEGALRLAVDPAWRDETQRQAALERELAQIESWDDKTVEIAGADEATAPVLAAVIERGAARVVLAGDTPVLVHPTLFAPPEIEPGRTVLRAAPAADDEMLQRQLDRELPSLLAAFGGLQDTDLTLVWPGAKKPFAGPLAVAIDRLREAGPAVLRVDGETGARPVQVHPEIVRRPVAILGRRDSSTPPMRLIGVEWTDDDDEVLVTRGQLEAMGDELRDARVLVTFQDHDGSELPPRRDDDVLVQGVRSVLDELAAATLLHRHEAGESRFEAVASKIDAVPIGQRFRDPRTPKPE